MCSWEENFPIAKLTSFQLEATFGVQLKRFTLAGTDVRSVVIGEFSRPVQMQIRNRGNYSFSYRGAYAISHIYFPTIRNIIYFYNPAAKIKPTSTQDPLESSITTRCRRSKRKLLYQPASQMFLLRNSILRKNLAPPGNTVSKTRQDPYRTRGKTDKTPTRFLTSLLDRREIAPRIRP